VESDTDSEKVAPDLRSGDDEVVKLLKGIQLGLDEAKSDIKTIKAE
jgi:hypothetical protein